MPTYTYSGDPTGSDVDEIRFLIQDTEDGRWILSNEEIGYLIATFKPQNGSNLFVAIQAARSCAAKFAGEPNVSGDGTSIDMEALQTKYERLTVTLTTQFRASLPGAGPDVGGIDLLGYPDPTVAPAAFAIGGNDNPRAGRQDIGAGPIYDPGELWDEQAEPWP